MPALSAKGYGIPLWAEVSHDANFFEKGCLLYTTIVLLLLLTPDPHHQHCELRGVPSPYDAPICCTLQQCLPAAEPRGHQPLALNLGLWCWASPG